VGFATWHMVFSSRMKDIEYSTSDNIGIQESLCL